MVEIIVATAIGVILIVGGVAAISPVLKITSDVARIQSAVALGKELLDNVGSLAEADWHQVSSLDTGPENVYHLSADASPFSVATGTEEVVLATTTYTRHFYLDEVRRNGFGEIESGASALDPSTLKLTVVYGWLQNATNTLVTYLTRARDEVFFMDDWSDGAGEDGPFTVTSTQPGFATSSNIDHAAHPGSLVITGF